MLGKLVLIQLPSPFLISDRDLPLMGILYIASSCRRAGIEVQIADLVGLSQEQWVIPEADVYGISFVTAQVPLAQQCVKMLRERTNHPVTIIAGGAHTSALPEWSLKYGDFDFAFKGEADNTVVDFMKGKDPKDIEGCYFWEGIRGDSLIKGNFRLPRVDLVEATLPARDLVDIRSFHRVGINRYVTEGVRYEGYLQTGRGCPFDCAFCAQAAITGRVARNIPVEHVLTDLHELLNKYECDLIYIEDDLFVIQKKRVLELCNAFKPIGFKWHCLCRADTMDDELAQAMAGAGCKNVTFGFETGSDKMLLAMDKGETMEETWAAIACVKRAGMGIRGQMIVGFPGETEETIEESAEFVRKAPVDRWGFHMFSLLPGTQAWRAAIAKGEINLDDPHLFDEGFETIGKPGQWSKRFYEPERAREWLTYLRGIADKRNIYELGVTDADIVDGKVAHIGDVGFEVPKVGQALNHTAWGGV